MDGVTAVTQRIAQITSQLAALAPPPTARPAAAGQQSFAAVLADAVTDAGAATRGSVHRVAPRTSTVASPLAAPLAGQATGVRVPSASTLLTRDGVPADLAAYGNGKIPGSALSPIGRGGHRLWAPAAEAFRRLSAAAQDAGVTIGVTDSYRSYDQQVDVARRKGLYSEGGLAAKPGTSDHGWGRSLDLDLNSRAQAWMRAHGARYGFVEDVPREPWHWTYSPPS